MHLEGKTAFLTGSATGIGRAAACAFAKAGANVAIGDLNMDELSLTRDMVEKFGAKAIMFRCDVTDPASVKKAVQKAIDGFGGLDCALNNAGMFGEFGNILKMQEEQARRLMEVNYWGVFNCLRAQIPVMLDRGGGTIVNMASSLGLNPGPHSASYSAAKHAVVGLTGSVAKEYAAKGIRINSVCPAFIETPMTRPLIQQVKDRGSVKGPNALGRFGQAEEVAEAVLWLSSPASSFVIGVNLPVDGGR